MIEKIKKKINLFLFLGIAIAIILISIIYYHEYRKDTITLGVFVGNAWNVPNSSSYQLIEDVIDKFERENKGVKVEYKSGILSSEYSEWLSSALVRGNAPDVFLVLSDDFTTFASVGALMDLSHLMKEDKDFDEKNFYSAAYDFGKLQGIQYALPFECVPNMMFVNKTLLEKNGISVPEEDWTWDDFYRICKKVTRDVDENGLLDQFGVYNYTWQEAFLTNDVQLFNESMTKCQLNSKNVFQAVSFLQELSNLNKGYQVTASDFDMGKVAFKTVLLSDYRAYKPYPWSIKKYSDFDWDCITLPKGPNGQNVSELQTVLMGINARTKKEDLAWELLKLFTYDKEIQMKIFKYHAGASVRRDVTNSEEAMELLNADMRDDSQINVKMIHNIMENARTQINYKKRDIIDVKLNDGIREIIQENKNKDTSLLILQRDINNELNN
ncbi:MAG: ABC transporter substrate-binding protein [Lachnospiraceae bacterium]